ncbi:acetate--CoA ligase family protein [Neptuniibacter sp.]|uniref:acetate--CoA ligase family protein n=1 Tax=Neptuniibacter sp. TaxID=1962643 RepID=UPI0026156C3D|nr:acetate--CoA ligase family protein [Neptuniibacter sp.]MCP4596127.1 cyanophycin synthetase [Neptuniibacter sp.]
MKPNPSSLPIQLKSCRAIPGYVPGYSQPQVIIELELNVSQVKPHALKAFDAIMKKLLSQQPNCPIGIALGREPVLGRLARCSLSILEKAGMPLFFETVRGLPKSGKKTATLIFPGLDHHEYPVREAVIQSIRLFNLAIAGRLTTNAGKQVETTIGHIKGIAPKGMNSLRFLSAADQSGIPWRKVRGNVYQFGWGVNARWLDSSFTDNTPNISAGLVRRKDTAAQILDSSLIPVPKHYLVTSGEQAIKAAEQLGYPVVVKPANLDGGKGVEVGLKTSHSVRDAYTRVSELSNLILVEEYIEGNDYRIQVFENKVLWASHRMPGGVTGDGITTVAELLDITNADPLRGEPGSNALLKRIKLDDEAFALLEEQNLSVESVPEVGKFVRLRRASNVASGGMPVPVLDIAHQDNLELAVRAARVLRLDLAGIDLLVPDISRSWKETGGAICEVNAQPQLFPHLPAEILEKLLVNKGRIPVVVIVGQVTEEPWFRALREALDNDGRCVGLALPTSTWIKNQQISDAVLGGYRGGSALINDSTVELAVLVIDRDEIENKGLPVDKIDLLVIAGPEIDDSEEDDWARSRKLCSSLCSISEEVCIDEKYAHWIESLTEGSTVVRQPEEYTNKVCKVISGM